MIFVNMATCGNVKVHGTKEKIQIIITISVVDPVGP